MTQFGKIIALVGVALVVVGAIAWVLGKAGFRGLPGDIVYKSERTTILVPIVSCIVLSVVLSVIVWLVRSLGK